MIRIYITNIDGLKHSLGTSLYYLLSNCVNKETNLIEFNGRPMNNMDLCAYANYSRSELVSAIKLLYLKNVIMNVRTKGKDFWYMNPEFIRDSEKNVEDFPFLMSIFNAEDNTDLKDLIYFNKTARNISINIGSLLPKEI